MIEMYKIFWQSRVTDEHGESNVSMTYEMAQVMAEYYGKKYPHIDHWVAKASLSVEKAIAQRQT